MLAAFRLSSAATVRTIALIAVVSAAACAPQYVPLQQVQANNLSVTFKYRNDQQLIQANQNAETFCDQYQAQPRSANFVNDPDGSKVVMFECVKLVSPAIIPTTYNPNLNYTYRTDQDMLEGLRDARMYCRNNGSQSVVSNVLGNSDGSRTVSYQCTPR